MTGVNINDIRTLAGYSFSELVQLTNIFTLKKLHPDFYKYKHSQYYRNKTAGTVPSIIQEQYQRLELEALQKRSIKELFDTGMIMRLYHLDSQICINKIRQ